MDDINELLNCFMQLKALCSAHNKELVSKIKDLSKTIVWLGDNSSPILKTIIKEFNDLDSTNIGHTLVGIRDGWRAKIVAINEYVRVRDKHNHLIFIDWLDMWVHKVEEI